MTENGSMLSTLNVLELSMREAVPYVRVSSKEKEKETSVAGLDKKTRQRRTADWK